MEFKTKEQRKEFYLRIRELFQYCHDNNTVYYKEFYVTETEDYSGAELVQGFCHVISSLTNISIYNSGIFKENFPELYKQKPKIRNGDTWWADKEDQAIRLKWLDNAIDLCN